jgi:hypothetical protein
LQRFSTLSGGYLPCVDSIEDYQLKISTVCWDYHHPLGATPSFFRLAAGNRFTLPVTRPLYRPTGRGDFSEGPYDPVTGRSQIPTKNRIHFHPRLLGEIALQGGCPKQRVDRSHRAGQIRDGRNVREITPNSHCNHEGAGAFHPPGDHAQRILREEPL